MPAASLRIDTSMVGITGPSNHNSAQFGSAATSLSARSARRQRSTSSASLSSNSWSPVDARDNASSPANRLRGGDQPSQRLLQKSAPDNESDCSEYVLAMHDFEPQQPNATCLAFKAGQIIRVFNRDPSGWWDGEVDSRRGWFPSNYVTSEVGLLTAEELPQLLVSPFLRSPSQGRFGCVLLCSDLAHSCDTISRSLATGTATHIACPRPRLRPGPAVRRPKATNFPAPITVQWDQRAL